LKLEDIKEIIKTVCFYNTVNITQTFCKDDVECIIVKCVKNTSILELTFVQTEQVMYYKSIDEAAKAIEMEINSRTFAY
jgi:hypothetical protein